MSYYEHQDGKATGCVIIIIIAIAACLFFWRIINRNLIGNKQLIDFRQTFNVAYLQMPDGTSKKIRVKKWNDYDQSDSIQIVSDNDVVYYTHLNRVVLTNERSDSK